MAWSMLAITDSILIASSIFLCACESSAKWVHNRGLVSVPRHRKDRHSAIAENISFGVHTGRLETYLIL